jgi:hypothetical protein
MSTYKNQVNAASGGGLLSRLGAMFGGAGTPAYRGDGQPSHVGGGFFGTATPAYKTTATVDAAAPIDAEAQVGDASLIGRPMIVIDPEALAAAGKIVLIVPHGMCAAPTPSVELYGQDVYAQSGIVQTVTQQ